MLAGKLHLKKTTNTILRRSDVSLLWIMNHRDLIGESAIVPFSYAES